MRMYVDMIRKHGIQRDRDNCDDVSDDIFMFGVGKLTRLYKQVDEQTHRDTESERARERGRA